MEKMIAEYLNCSSEEILSDKRLCAKINVVRSLYSENKINSGNAFDLDMTDSLHEWLKNKKREKNTSLQNLFDDLSDYLDATAKIYTHRIDNVNKTLNGLYNEVKITAIKNEINNSATNEHIEPPQVKKKRTRAMLTTDDKLSGKPIELMPTLNTNLLDMEELKKVASPAKYIASVLSNTTIEEDLKQSRENCKKKPKIENMSFPTNIVSKNEIQKILASGVIDPGLDKLLAERDQQTPNTTEDTVFECIEDHFDPKNNPVKKYIEKSICEKKNQVIDQSEPDSMPDDPQRKLFNGLVACVDVEKSDYSFFDPQRLANWPGPKEWKAMTMARTLRTRNLSSEHAVTSTENNCEDYQVHDSKKGMSKKNQSKEKIQVKWMDMDTINSEIKKMSNSQKVALPHNLQKWHYSNNVCDPLSFDVIHKFTFLEQLKIQPNWIISQKDVDKQENKEESFSCNFLLDKCQNNYNGNIENIIDGKTSENDHYVDNNISLESIDDEDDEVPIQETLKDVGELKLEILDIINQECTVFSPNSEWSNSLHLRDLLSKLKFSEQSNISEALVFVSLLHLCNENGLKMTNGDDSKQTSMNQNSTGNDVYIFKPKPNL